MAGYYKWPLYEFDEERDLDPYYKVWVLYAQFCIPALKPFDGRSLVQTPRIV